MKKVILIFCIVLFCLNAEAQTYTETLPLNEKGMVEYSGVVDIENTTKQEIAKRVKKWVIDAYKNPKEVILLETEDELRGKGAFSVFILAGLTKNKTEILGTFKMNIEYKDNKFRYSFNEILFNTPGTKMSAESLEQLGSKRIKKGKNPLQSVQEYTTQTNETFKKLSESLKDSVKNPKKSDW